MGVIGVNVGVNALLYREISGQHAAPSWRQAQCECLLLAARARPNPDELLTEIARAFDLPRNAVLDRRQAQAYRCAVYLLRQVMNEPIAKVARRAGISAPRVSQIQAEAESSKPQGPMRMLLDCYKVKR